jgi:hypothetical protein
MCRFLAAACWLILVVTVSAQTDRGSLSGTVSYASGLIVPDAPVQAKHKETGAIIRTVSAADGGYVFADISAGVYELSIAMPGCSFDPFAGDVTVRAGQTTRLDVRLVDTLNGQTLGDDPCRIADMIRRRSRVPSLPVRRFADGQPDLSGAWLVSQDRFPEQPAALPWAVGLAKERVESNFKDAPHTRCLPEGFPVPSATPPFLTKFVHTPALLVILFEDVPGFRQVFLDGRDHPVDPNPTWMGHSVGKWEGDTLVVDTIGFNDRSWINEYPHTEQLHMTERYRRVDFGHLENRVTFEDPGTFTKPWNMNLTWDLAPQEELIEFVCENNKPEHMVGK